ncbi:hypothetical protein EDB86DRAFT_2944299 [Lactarius hatsudake]|nr:hypothetical protein EDB86DRAFT_2944299 [Lactarius hatsudake]
MLISIPAFLSYLLIIGPTRAQVSAPNCTDSTFAWSYNSLQQNPCWVSAYLEATCNNGLFSVPPLPPGRSYAGPSTGDIDKNNICQCNTVVYNLISACDACQGSGWISYFAWSFNCTTKVTPGTFPNPVPAGTRVPKWAYIDSYTGDSWNISAAQLTGDSPEVTGTVSIVPTRFSQSTLTPTSSVSRSGSLSTSAPTPHSRSNTGAIAGGVVGGIVGAALIAGIWSWFAIRQRRARSAPYPDFQGGKREHQPPYSLAEGAPKVYDPSDPTTYPSKVYLPLAMSNQRFGSASHLQPNNCGYRGLPEV